MIFNKEKINALRNERVDIVENLSKVFAEELAPYPNHHSSNIFSSKVLCRVKKINEDGSLYKVDFINGNIEYRAREGSTSLIHREDGPAIINSNGDKYYFYCDILHRENGPAIELVDGTKEFHYKGFMHNANGPAIIKPDGSTEYWFYGNKTIESMLPKLNTMMNFM